MIKMLPHWVLENPTAAFYDTESGSSIEQTARVYAKMQELIEDYNKFVDDINKHIALHEAGLYESNEAFKTCIINTIENYIKSIDMKIDEQDKHINDTIVWIKENYVGYLKDIFDEKYGSGEIADIFSSVLKPAIDKLDEKLTTKIEALETNLNTNIENTSKNTTDIETLKTNSSKNTTDIESLTTNLATANTNIGKNTTDIGTLATILATANTNISENTTNIGTLTTNLATANTNISKNTADIETNKTDISNLTSRVDNIQAPTSETITIAENFITLEKKDKLCVLYILGGNAMTLTNGESTLIGTIPEGYRPKTAVGDHLSLKDANWNIVAKTGLIVTTNGEIKVEQHSGAEVYTAQMIATLSYFTE